MCSPKLFGGFELIVDDVHGDDRVRAETAQELNRVETDAAATDNQGRVAGLQPAAMLDGVVGCRDAAADDAGFLHGHLTWNSEYHVCRHRHILGKAANIPAANRCAVRFSERRWGRASFTEIFPGGQTVAAAATLVAHADNDPVPRFEVLAAWADLLEGSRDLVPQNRRWGEAVSPLDDF